MSRSRVGGGSPSVERLAKHQGVFARQRPALGQQVAASEAWLLPGRNAGYSPLT